MLNEKNERELAYVVAVDAIESIPGKDRVECARVGGWTCMVPKGAFMPGSLGVYFEIDSHVDTMRPEFAFTEKYHGNIKTQKFRNPDGSYFYSQGLLMPFSDFGWAENAYKVGDFLTKELGVIYAEASDNERKSNSVDKYKKMAQRNTKLFRKAPFKWLMRRAWGRKFLFFFFGKKLDKKNDWPSWVVKTDEERAQNLPQLFTNPDGAEWIATEKVDGSSTTFTMLNDKHKKLIVCSRNVAFVKEGKKCFYDTNIYTEMAEKYNVAEVMKFALEHCLVEGKTPTFFTIQAETFGAGVQRRDYGLTDRDLRVFNIIFGFSDGSVVRLNPEAGEKFAKEVLKMPYVPVIGRMVLPATCKELITLAGGASKIDGGMREGLVFRSIDGKRSFKAVDPEFLLKFHN